MNHVSLKPLAPRAPPRATEDFWRDHPCVMRLRNFVDLTHGDLRRLRAVIESEPIVRKRRDLVLDGYEFSKLCIIREGFAARYKLLRNGKRQIVNFVLPGDLVGLPSSFLECAAHSVIAVTDMRLQICPLESFVEMCCRQPKFGLVLAWLAAQEAATYAEHIIDVGRRSPVERLAHLLLEIHSRLAMIGAAGDCDFVSPFTQEMMSDALGLSVPHLNRMLRKLCADGLIRVSERRIEFIDLKAIQQLAHFKPIQPARIPIPADLELE